MPEKKPTPFWKRLLSFVLFGIIIISAFLILCPWVGPWEWAQTKNGLLARGENLASSDFIPPPVPDKQNFFSDPVWMELTGQVDVVTSDGLFEKELKIPFSKLQLATLDTPMLTKEEIAETKKQFPMVDWSGGESGFRIASQVLDNYATTGVEQRKAASAFAFLQLAYPAPMLDHIGELAKRPLARFPIRYSDGINALLPHLDYLLKAASVLGLRAKVHLASGDPEEALKDLSLLLHLSNTVEKEPKADSLMYRMRILNIALSTVDHGIEVHQWRPDDLIYLEEFLGQTHIGPEFSLVLRAQRAGFNESLEQIVSPGGYRMLPKVMSMDNDMGWPAFDNHKPGTLELRAWWIYKTFLYGFDGAHYDKAIQSMIDGIDKMENPGSINTDRGRKSSLLSITQNYLNSWLRPLSYMTLAGEEFLEPGVLLTYDHLVQTRIACALERYRIKNGAYPENLGALAPEFIPKIPTDPLTGKPMIYRWISADAFLLYSVGWDRVDDGGAPVPHYQTSGDWVWGTPSIER